MGDKRPSIRTLDSGEKVTHFPADDAHPEGKMVLIRETSPLKDRLDAQLEENQRRHEAIKQDHLDRIAVKRADQQGKGLPPEKSHV
jgi:hypothetical protein